MSEEKAMCDLVAYIARSLVDDPDGVAVQSHEDEGGATVIELHVAESDMGKVIGKQGRIAKAIRTIVKAASVRSQKKYIAEIV